MGNLSHGLLVGYILYKEKLRVLDFDDPGIVMVLGTISPTDCSVLRFGLFYSSSHNHLPLTLGSNSQKPTPSTLEVWGTLRNRTNVSIGKPRELYGSWLQETTTLSNDANGIVSWCLIHRTLFVSLFVLTECQDLRFSGVSTRVAPVWGRLSDPS